MRSNFESETRSVGTKWVIKYRKCDDKPIPTGGVVDRKLDRVVPALNNVIPRVIGQ
jgi:hypothetical protein